MADKNELKIHDEPRPHSDFETAVVKGVEYVRDPEGTWRYADSWIKVPGGRDWTLTERFSPKFVIASSKDQVGRIERVVVSGKEIEKHTDLLGWCLELGYPVQGPGGEIFEVMVPFDIWNDHDRIPGMIYAPELHGTDAERELAQAEREYREADRALEVAATKRAETLRRHSEEMTRQQARAITDLSVGRIQQLIREGLPALDAQEVLMLALIDQQKPKSLGALQAAAKEDLGLVRSAAAITRQVRQLEERALIARDSSGFRLTPEGKEAVRASREQVREVRERDN
ncbi:MAG TPA: hypothetical protein VFZ19_12375 [Solirubrobacterales bacterium]